MRSIVKHREALDLVVVAGVVAERALGRGLVAGRIARVGPDEAFEHDLGGRRHLQVVRQALDDLGARAAQQPGELVFGQRVGHRRHRAEDRRRIGAQRDRDRKRRARDAQRVVAEVERAAAMGEPAHDHLVARDHLLPVDAEVLPRLVRAARDGEAPGDQRTGVARPAGLHRQPREIDVGALPHDLLARRRRCAPSAPCPAPS